MFRTVTLLGLLTGILMAIGWLTGGYGGAIMALIFAFLINFGSYWYSDQIVLRMYNAQELPVAQYPTIHQVVSRLAAKAKIPKPKVYLVRMDNPNAFATGRDPEHAAVAVTSGLLNRLEPAEIEGVIAHELAHIKNRDTLVSCIAATIAGAITWIAHMLSFALIFGGGRRGSETYGAIFMLIFAPLAATLVRLAISRGREFGADEVGAKISGKPLSLASALRKIATIARARPLEINPSTSHLFIINPLRHDSISNLFSTHPPLEARIKRLEKMA